MKMWIARTRGDDLQFIYGNIYEQPIYNELEGLWEAWNYDSQFNAYKTYGSWIEPNQFLEVTFENSPIEVELVIKSQNKVTECHNCHEVIKFTENDVIDGWYVKCPCCEEEISILL